MVSFKRQGPQQNQLKEVLPSLDNFPSLNPNIRRPLLSHERSYKTDSLQQIEHTHVFENIFANSALVTVVYIISFAISLNNFADSFIAFSLKPETI